MNENNIGFNSMIRMVKDIMQHLVEMEHLSMTIK